MSDEQQFKAGFLAGYRDCAMGVRVSGERLAEKAKGLIDEGNYHEAIHTLQGARFLRMSVKAIERGWNRVAAETPEAVVVKVRETIGEECWAELFAEPEAEEACDE